MLDFKEKIKVLVVDDSSFIRKIIVDILNRHPNINVVGIAVNGQMAVSQLEKLDIDVITLDVEMPIMNGLDTLREIQKLKPTPTIMLSSLTYAGADVTIQALELGAVDFIQKPLANTESEIQNLEKELITKILLAAIVKRNSTSLKNVKQVVETKLPEIHKLNKPVQTKTVVIGTSTGGPQALKELLPNIPRDLPAKFLIIQHMPEKFTTLLAQRLDKITKIDIQEAKENDYLEKNTALLAPGNYHMTVEKGRIKLNQNPPTCGVRPAVDATLVSAAEEYGENVICVILTGMGKDGTNGAKIVKKYGGYCIAEDKSTCTIFGMPKSLIDAGLADEVVPLNKIPDAIVKAIYRQ